MDHFAILQPVLPPHSLAVSTSVTTISEVFAGHHQRAGARFRLSSKADSPVTNTSACLNYAAKALFLNRTKPEHFDKVGRMKLNVRGTAVTASCPLNRNPLQLHSSPQRKVAA
jgi:hypothetical protein